MCSDIQVSILIIHFGKAFDLAYSSCSAKEHCSPTLSQSESVRAHEPPTDIAMYQEF